MVSEEVICPSEGQQFTGAPEVPQYYIQLLEEKVMNEISRYLADAFQVNHAFQIFLGCVHNKLKQRMSGASIMAEK